MVTTGVVITHVDLFATGAQTIVNTVNCFGVMGKGVALRFRRAYPDMYIDYADRCRREEVKPGIPYLYVDRSGARIINFPTKNHWRYGSRIDWIDDGLRIIAERAKEWGITSLAMPLPGCGNGGLDRNQVIPLIETRLGRLGFQVFVCMGT